MAKKIVRQTELRCDICSRPINRKHETLTAERFHVKVTLRGLFWSFRNGQYWQHYDICNRCMQTIFRECQKANEP